MDARKIKLGQKVKVSTSRWYDSAGRLIDYTAKRNIVRSRDDVLDQHNGWTVECRAPVERAFSADARTAYWIFKVVNGTMVWQCVTPNDIVEVQEDKVGFTYDGARFKGKIVREGVDWAEMEIEAGVSMIVGKENIDA